MSSGKETLTNDAGLLLIKIPIPSDMIVSSFGRLIEARDTTPSIFKAAAGELVIERSSGRENDASVVELVRSMSMPDTDTTWQMPVGVGPKTSHVTPGKAHDVHPRAVAVSASAEPGSPMGPEAGSHWAEAKAKKKRTNKSMLRGVRKKPSRYRRTRAET